MLTLKKIGTEFIITGGDTRTVFKEKFLKQMLEEAYKQEIELTFKANLALICLVNQITEVTLTEIDEIVLRNLGSFMVDSNDLAFDVNGQGYMHFPFALTFKI
jgi:hypothetical protein